jgi:transposase
VYLSHSPGLVRDRTSMMNQLRGVLSEFGIVMPKGRYPAQNAIVGILEDAENGLPMVARRVIDNLWQRIKHANEQIQDYDRELAKFVKEQHSESGLPFSTHRPVVACYATRLRV